MPLDPIVECWHVDLGLSSKPLYRADRRQTKHIGYEILCTLPDVELLEYFQSRGVLSDSDAIAIKKFMPIRPVIYEELARIHVKL